MDKNYEHTLKIGLPMFIPNHNGMRLITYSETTCFFVALYISWYDNGTKEDL